MAILVRIKLPNRSEYRKIIRTKKDNFDLLGDNYIVDFNSAYISTIHLGFTKIQTLDYEKGEPHPVQYYGTPEERLRTKHTPKTVAELIRRLLEEIPHFQWIMIIMVAVAIAIGGVSAYMAYDAGNKAKDVGTLLANFYTYYLNQFNMSGYP